MKLKKILVPTDFSAEANNALEVAISLAKQAGAVVDVLHIVDVPDFPYVDSMALLNDNRSSNEDPELYKLYVHKLMELTRQKMEALKAAHEGVEIHDHVGFDTLQKHLADFVVREKSDLIVIGSKGASGLEEVLVGSNTERVIRYAKVPVLTVKGDLKDFKPKNIVFASSFLDTSEKVANSLKAYQAIFGAKLHFVKVITPNSFESTPSTEKVIHAFAKKYHFENYEVHGYNYFTEEEGIRSFAQSRGFDLIAMTTHGRTGIGHLLLGSIAEEVANHAQVPVLTFNQNFR